MAEAALHVAARAARLNATLDALEQSLDSLNEGWLELLEQDAAVLDQPETLEQAHIAARASAQLNAAISALRAAAQAELRA
ncbi:MAG: hypothetical protein GC189_04470 [Alphaproteobacteria bacterium]|nr:hypothetical protein [Alphaproteobacteria bacterium]